MWAVGLVVFLLGSSRPSGASHLTRDLMLMLNRSAGGKETFHASIPECRGGTTDER